MKLTLLSLIDGNIGAEMSDEDFETDLGKMLKNNSNMVYTRHKMVDAEKTQFEHQLLPYSPRGDLRIKTSSQ